MRETEQASRGAGIDLHPEKIIRAADDLGPGVIFVVPGPAPDKRGILEAAQTVVAARGQNYGAVAENFERIARRWRAHIQNRFGVAIALDAVSVALMMDDVKSARLENDPGHLDSWVDKAGYAACGGEVAGKGSA